MASDDTAQQWAAWRKLGSYEWIRLSQQEGAQPPPTLEQEREALTRYAAWDTLPCGHTVVAMWRCTTHQEAHTHGQCAWAHSFHLFYYNGSPEWLDDKVWGTNAAQS